MTHYEANAYLTKVDVNMGDHAQDVIRAMNLPRWKTIGDILDEYLNNDPENFITIRSVAVKDVEYDVGYEAFENACAEHAAEILDDVAMWPHGYEEQGVDFVRDYVRSLLKSAGLSVHPGAPPKQQAVPF